jgi:tetratricopeptide (TPR) repeat protein
VAKRPEENIPGQQCGKKPPMPVSMPAHLLPVLIVAFVSFVVYFSALFNNFVYDDMTQVLQNPWIRDVRHLPDIFLKSVWSFQTEHDVSNYYRPLMHCIYMITYYAFGLKPWGFHLVNVLFHAGVSVLVFLTAAKLPGYTAPPHPPLTKGGSKEEASTFLSASFIAALLFATHPIHTEAVAWVAGLPDLSYSFFFLLSFWLYIVSTGETQVHRWRYSLSILSFSLAVLCKEPALTLPAILIGYDYIFRKEKGSFSVYLRRYIPYFIVGGVYLLLRLHALGGFAPDRRHTDLSTYQYVINVFPLFMQYLEKLFLPVDLNAFHVLRPIFSLTDMRGIVAIVITAAFVFLLFISFKKDKTLLLSLLFIAIPLLPVLYIPGLGENTFAERYLYLPSFGFVLLASSAIMRIRQRHKGTMIAFVLLAAVTALYSAATITRNFVWRDNLSLFSDTVEKSPDAAIPRNMLGNALLDWGRADEAISHYNSALTLKPSDYQTYNNRALAFSQMGRFDEAIADFDRAIALNPRCYQAYNNKGKLYGQTGSFDKAVEQFDKALEINPDSSLAYGNRGLAYFLIGEYGKALEDLDKAIALDSNYSEAFGTRGNIYLRAGKRELAMADFKKACDLGDQKGCDVLKRNVK